MFVGGINKFVGSHTECQYSLLTFGVPVQNIPITYDGKVKTASHLKFLSRRQAVESKSLKQLNNQQKQQLLPKQQQQSNLVENDDDRFDYEGTELPSNVDVLLGRGRPLQVHTGNLQMRSLVEIYQEEYERAQYGGKAAITEKIVKVIKGQGGHFLKQEKAGWWVPVTDDVAQEKVSHTFRTARISSSSTTAAGAAAIPVGNNNAKRIRVEKNSSSAASSFDAKPSSCFCGS